MDPEVKARWVAALRSGEYKQGKFALCTRSGFQGQEGDTFCCLGVINEVERLGCDDDEACLVRAHPVHRARTKLDIVPHRAQKFLADMNDGHGWSFSKIADWIEENL